MQKTNGANRPFTDRTSVIPLMSAMGRKPNKAQLSHLGGKQTFAAFMRVALRGRAPMLFTDKRMDGVRFTNCSLANATFDDVNLKNAKLSNVNLSGVTVENANIQGLKIFGYDVEAWIKEQLAKDGCHLD